MGLKIGICGVGQFGPQFITLFKAPPDVDEVVLADLFADRLAERAKEHQIVRTYPSLDELCTSDVDAIAIFTQRWMHGPMAIQALRAGKHVYSAVPATSTLEELDELVKTVEETGLTYMLGETSYYRPQTIWCREKFANGDFGEFVYRGTAKATKRRSEDVSWVRDTSGVEITEENLGDLPGGFIGKKHLGVAKPHHVERLAKELVGLKNGHEGSHQFMVVDFVEALKAGQLPPNHVWLSARYNAPGIVAHESAKRGGELMEIPDFGRPPADAVLMDPLANVVPGKQDHGGHGGRYPG